MSDSQPEVEEAREIIKVRRISAKPTPDAEKKKDEAEAAKARQAELEKRLRRLQLSLSVAVVGFLLLGLRVLGCFPTPRTKDAADSLAVVSEPLQEFVSPRSASTNPAFSASPPNSRSIATPGAPAEFRRIFSAEPFRIDRFPAPTASANPPSPAFSASTPTPTSSRLPTSFPSANSTPTLDDLRVVRIASWNLEPLDFSKVTDLAIGEKIARILQEFDVVAVQGVRTQNRAVLEALVYLIGRQGGEYDYIASPPSPRDSISATFFNVQTIVVDRDSVSNVYDARGRLSTPALVANFRPNAVAAESCFTFQIINLRLPGVSAHGEALADLLTTLKKRAGGFGLAEDDLIVAGDFGVSIQKIKEVDKIPNAATLHQTEATDVDGGASGNLLFDSVATIEYVERFGVVDLADYFNISDAEVRKMARGRPVWGDFSVYEGGDPNFFAPEGGGAPF